MLPLSNELSVPGFVRVLAELVTVAGAMFGAVAWILAPRIGRRIDHAIEPLRQRLGSAEHRIDRLDESQDRMERAIEKVGEDISSGLNNLGDSIRELAKNNAELSVNVAEMRGRMDEANGPRPRRPRGGRS